MEEIRKLIAELAGVSYEAGYLRGQGDSDLSLAIKARELAKQIAELIIKEMERVSK